MRKLTLMTTTAVFASMLLAAPAVMAQNSTGQGTSGSPGSASSDPIQVNPPTYTGGMGQPSGPSGTMGSASSSARVGDGANLDASQRDRATSSAAAVGAPMTASGAASAQSYGDGSLNSSGTQPVPGGVITEGSQAARNSSSMVSTGEPLSAGAAASALSYRSNTDVIGKGPAGPGVDRPSAMLVPPGASMGGMSSGRTM